MSASCCAEAFPGIMIFTPNLFSIMRGKEIEIFSAFIFIGMNGEVGVDFLFLWEVN
jgi:hypothetical protein